MKSFSQLTAWQQYRQTWDPKLSVGFVPTMGNLHAGHLSLIEKCRAENARCIVSIFINPHQFNHADDYKQYPRTLTQDLALLEKAEVDYCLLPSVEEIYADDYQFQIQENQLSRSMEGKHRPGHFEGVLSIVMKLVQLTQPHRMYMGEKDYQQYLLVKAMLQSFFNPCEVIACPTVRTASGLALSSRNHRLSPEQMALAEAFAAIFHQRQNSCQAIQQALSDQGIRVDYIEEAMNRRFAAVFIDDIRLIDNYALNALSN